MGNRNSNTKSSSKPTSTSTTSSTKENVFEDKSLQQFEEFGTTIEYYFRVQKQQLSDDIKEKLLLFLCGEFMKDRFYINLQFNTEDNQTIIYKNIPVYKFNSGSKIYDIMSQNKLYPPDVSIPRKRWGWIINVDKKKTLGEQFGQNDTLIAYMGRTPGELYIKTLTGKTIVFDQTDLDFSCTVIQLKELIFKRENIPVDQQRLIFAGKQLQDELTLSDCNMEWCCTLHLVLRLQSTNPT